MLQQVLRAAAADQAASKGSAARLHLLRAARHQPARRGLRGPDVLHRVLRRPRTLYEVAKDGDPAKGSWVVPRRTADEYDEKHVVRAREDPTDRRRRSTCVHPKGTFVFRLAGRDRQRSASYYTPEVLTQCVVKHALAELITDETLRPAVHSGLSDLRAGAGLRRVPQRGDQPARRRVPATPPGRAGRRRSTPRTTGAELQKVKAHIALHQCYGVDLNATAVELAEVSLWLNAMHPGLQAPWFGLHLRRGNSLIGARRATYDLTALGKAKKSWLSTPPADRPLVRRPDRRRRDPPLPAAGRRLGRGGGRQAGQGARAGGGRAR